MSAAAADPPDPSPPAVYAALLDVLDDVLDEGVPRSAVSGTDTAALIDGWRRAIEHATAVTAALRASWGQREIAADALARLVVAAGAVDGMARSSGLAGAIAAGELPAFAALRGALDAAYAHARAAGDTPRG